MEPADMSVFSVIVKIWVDDSDGARWHGQVTHIPSGEQYYVSRIEDLGLIITRYLAAFGIKPSPGMRVQQWLQRLRLR